MTRIFHALAIALVAVAVISCAKTDELDNGIDDFAADGQPLTFTIKGINNSMTRAIATAEEYAVEEVQIFMFDYTGDTPGTGLLRGIWKINVADLNATGQHLTADLGVLSSDDYGTDEKIYYFVANGLGIASITEGASGLEIYDGSTNDATATKEEDFVNAMTETLADASLTLERPLLFSGRSENWGLSGATGVELRRRAARFDIVNDIPDQFIIKKVEIETPAANAYIFAENDGATAITYSTAKYDFTESTYAKDFSLAASYEQKTGANGLELICESAFYLYPTEVPAQTTITITADYDGTVNRQFYVNQTVQILPNHRYKLVVSPDRLMFMLVLADWEEAEEAPVSRIGTLTIENLAVAAGATQSAGSLNSEAYRVADNDNLTLEFDITCSSNKGVTYIAPANAAIANAVITPGAVSANATRANGAAYRQSMTVAIDYNTPVSDAWEIVYNFIDAADTKSMGTLVLWNKIDAPQPGSNSYIVKPNSPAIYIPVNHGVTEGYNTIGSTDVIEAAFLWTDVPGGKTSSSVVKAVTALGVGNTGYLRVEPAHAAGNAVVAVKVDGKIKWSWHIWNTNYDPSTDNYTYTSTGTQSATMPDAGSAHTFMDRNLGARSSTPGDAMSGGLLYQFGRKDPFIGKNSWTDNTTETPLYDANGAEFTTAKIAAQNTPNGGNPNTLTFALENPATFIYGAENLSEIHYDWYTTVNDRAAQNNYLWATLDGSNNAEKAIFDPCPKGWRVPADGAHYGLVSIAGDAYTFPWSSSTYGRFGVVANPLPIDGIDNSTNGNATTAGVSATVGYYPASGYRSYMNGSLSDMGDSGYNWSSTAILTDGYSYYLSFGRTGLNATSAYNRSCGFPVRCIKE